MNDLISRQAAIDAMDDIANFVCVKDEDYILQEEAIDNLKQLPSAQPEPERTMEEFMFGQDMGNPEDGSL